ncbi:MAG: LEA type 2 family protein [Treponema sp.]|jgi:LEA14-like dessication related protein|nr:LEA type 2 family protein [Treponema sp.]
MSRCFHRALQGIVLATILLSFVCCKTPPASSIVELIKPAASLEFISVEARDISFLKLNYILHIEYPGLIEAQVGIDKWSVTVNDKAVNIAPVFSLEKREGAYFFSVIGTEDKPAVMEIPVSLELDIPFLIAAGVPLTDDFTVALTLDLLNTNILGKPIRIQLSETAVFPFVREPIFSITGIAILQAELINTRFSVYMRIDNPNHFPVELSAFKYELYGNGRLWASGTERNMFTVPAKTSVIARLYVVMNFIDMDRNLLEQIIRLESVNYRFNGEAFVSTGVDYLPSFTSGFDLSGYSEVLEN